MKLKYYLHTSTIIVLIFTVTGCATIQKSLESQKQQDSLEQQVIEISQTKENYDAMMSMKCAIQQAGWYITYIDQESVTATKAYGDDKVKCTLNVRFEASTKELLQQLLKYGIIVVLTKMVNII